MWENGHNWATCSSDLKLANSLSNLWICSGGIPGSDMELMVLVIACCWIKFNSALRAAASSSAYNKISNKILKRNVQQSIVLKESKVPIHDIVHPLPPSNVSSVYEAGLKGPPAMHDHFWNINKDYRKIRRRGNIIFRQNYPCNNCSIFLHCYVSESFP